MIDLRSFFRGRRAPVAVIRARLPEATHIELVQSLFGHTLPAVIMTCCFVGAGAYILTRTGDGVLTIFYGLGLLASAVRLTALFRYRARSGAVGRNVAHMIERRFGIAYIAFAAVFGAFAARAFWVADAEHHELIVALVFGYGAGVAATVSLRPWIGISAILVAIVPLILVSLFLSGADHWGTGILTALFLTGGVQSMIQRYRDTVAQISMRRLMEKLARQDDLTGLPNRLVLRERFEQLAERSTGGELIAVHRVDINRLDPVNETYGHMAGDALLKAVAQRLRRVVRGDNLVVHLNGDDFVIVQPNITDIAKAELLAHQVVATLDKSYAVAGEDIIISANIGYAVDVQRGAELEQLLLGAGRALTSGKRKASGVAAYQGSPWGAEDRRAG